MLTYLSTYLLMMCFFARKANASNGITVSKYHSIYCLSIQLKAQGLNNFNYAR